MMEPLPVTNILWGNMGITGLINNNIKQCTREPSLYNQYAFIP